MSEENDEKIVDNDNNSNYYDYITTDNVEEELKKLKIIDDYDSDEYEHDRICLTSSGVDIKALKAGQDVEFLVEPNENDYDFDDRNEPIDYEKIFKYRNLEVIGGVDDAEDEASPHDSKTPFEILKSKMIDITQEKNEGVMKRVLVPGFGLPIPNGSCVRVHYNAYFEMNDEPFDSTYLRNKSFQFKIGANEVVIGLDIGVATMKRKEKAQFIFQPEYYCGKFGCEPRVPRETPVLFEVEVISVLELGPLDEFNMSTEEERRLIPFQKILQICNCLRELGNDNFARQNYRDASTNYRKAIYIMEHKNTQNDEEDAKQSGVLLKLYLNMSQISLKQRKPKKCIYYCKMALSSDPKNVKALFRYGKALRILQDFDRSRTYLMKAMYLQPTNREITKEIEELNDMISKYNRLEKDMYKRMFKSESNASKIDTSQVTNVSAKILNEPTVGSAFQTANDNNNNLSNPVDTKNQTESSKINDKRLNEETKLYIVKNLREFSKDDKKDVFKIQADSCPEPMVSFIMKQSELLGLTTRLIKGNTNVLQIMK